MHTLPGDPEHTFRKHLGVAYRWEPLRPREGFEVTSDHKGMWEGALPKLSAGFGIVLVLALAVPVLAHGAVDHTPYSTHAEEAR